MDRKTSAVDDASAMVAKPQNEDSSRLIKTSMNDLSTRMNGKKQVGHVFLSQVNYK